MIYILLWVSIFESMMKESCKSTYFYFRISVYQYLNLVAVDQVL